MGEILRLIFYLFGLDSWCRERLIIFVGRGLGGRRGKEDGENRVLDIWESKILEEEV